MKTSITDVLRTAFTPNLENMLRLGEVVPAMGSGKKLSHAHPLPCSICNHPVAVIKGKNGSPLCAACLTLSAKMPCVSDPGKPEKNRGLSPCNPKGGGMGMLITPDSVRFYVKQEKFDLVFLDTVEHTCIPFVTADHVWVASVQNAMDLPDGTRYWWGIVQENDIYPTLRMFARSPWDIAQDRMIFRNGSGEVVQSDTRNSWRALAEVKSNPDYVRIMRSLKRIVGSESEAEKRKAKIAAMPWQEYPELTVLASRINKHALMASF